MKVLAGDIGGTTARLLLAAVERGAVRPIFEADSRSGDYPDLAPLVQAFLADAGEAARGVAAACFAVAGPVAETPEGETAQVTNLPWRLDSAALSEMLGLPRTRLINDFQAAAYGLEALAPTDLLTLQPGRPVPGAPRVLIGAGTGLGEAVLVWTGEHYRPLPSEGGHADLAPGDTEEQALLAHLRERFGHVSWERAVSGPGLVNVFEFLRAHRRREPSPALAEALAAGDAAAAISESALAQRDGLAMAALAMLVRLYGAQAGNLALTVLARGGVYIGGGIAPKILEWLRHGPFLEAFR
ncbi:MAG: glucokinase, partial [Gammaproteobacteria bacterium]|nr:glucokinase [Gammaproteobacteria bacterium]